MVMTGEEVHPTGDSRLIAAQEMTEGKSRIRNGWVSGTDVEALKDGAEAVGASSVIDVRIKLPVIDS